MYLLTHPTFWRPQGELSACICTIDGQVAEYGDCSVDVCLQEIMFCISYLCSRDVLGRDEVHKLVGREYSGLSSHAVSLNDDRRPHNPLVDIGALQLCGSIFQELNSHEKYSRIATLIQKMAGNSKVAFNRQSYCEQSDDSTQLHNLASRIKEQMPDFKDEAAIELFLEVCLNMHWNSSSSPMHRCTAQRSHCTH